MSIRADALQAKTQIYINSISNRVEPSDFYEFFTEAIRELRRGRTMPEQRRTFTKDFFTGVFQYALPTDFDSMIKTHASLFEESDQGPYLIYGRDKDFFANNKYGLAITNEIANRYLLARIEGKKDLQVDSFDSTDVTAYAVTGDGSNILNNTYEYKENESSLQFDIVDATHTTTVTKTLPETIDITDFINYGGTSFLYFYMPSVVTSLKIQLVSSVGNYYETLPITTNFYGGAFTTGWNLLALPLNTVITTGTPDKTLIASYNIVINNTGVSANGFLLDAFYLRIPTKMEFPYNSKYLVLDNDGVTYKETVGVGTDLILCDDTFEAVIMYNAVWHAGQWKYNDADLASNGLAKFKQAMIEFNRRWPSTEAPVQSNYYRRNKF